MTVPDELDRRLREAAAEAGLVDVAYDVAETPIGPLLLARTEAGLCRVHFGEDEEALDGLARAFGTRVLRAPRRLDEARRQLEGYFTGARRDFELELDLRVTPFHRAVLAELVRVPYGSTTTYAALAARVGRPAASRAVGRAMHTNPIAIVLPCHRVLGASGSLTGYAGGLDVKRRLLELEGALGQLEL
ncbi:MAG: methylated-DNA--[protein]-cysteine S-methyltransferase [Thermoleophilia bacterium]